MDRRVRRVAAGLVVVLLAGIGWASWTHFRARPVPMSQPTIVYSWTDAHGVVHFSQQGGEGKPMVVDPSRMLTLGAPPHRLRQLFAAGQDKPASGSDIPGEQAPPGANISQAMVEHAVDGDNAPPESR